jgi:hypothetical protein
MWARRVAEWKASGLSSPTFCEGKPFTAGGLRHWSHRLRREGQRRPASVRMARLVRFSTLKSAPAESGTGTAPDLVIAIGAARVAVRRGVDRGTLATVVDVLAAADGSGR